MTGAIPTPSVVLGIGLSSKATADEVRALVTSTLKGLHLGLHDVAGIATREQFERDPRLDLGLPITGVADDVLVARSAPCERTVGPRARVAETAALVVSTSIDGALLGPVERSAHVTVAVVKARRPGASA